MTRLCLIRDQTMANLDEVNKILMKVDDRWPGERTPALLDEYACVLANLPLKRLEKIEQRFIHGWRRWPVLDEWLDLSDKIAEEEKAFEAKQREQGHLKHLHSTGEIFNPPKHNKIAEACCKIYHKYIKNPKTRDLKKAGEAMIKAGEELSNELMQRNGAGTVRNALKRGIIK